MTKHNWKITSWKGKFKNYNCECGKHIIAANKKEADKISGECESFFQKWSKAIEVIDKI